MRFMNNYPADKVYYEIKGVRKELPYSVFTSEGSWTFENENLAVLVTLPEISEADLPVTVYLTGNFAASSKMSGVKGVLRHANMAKWALDQAQATPS